MICVYTAIIPGNKCINDNWGQSYRTQMGALDWLSWQYDSIKNGYWEKYIGRGENRHLQQIEYKAPAEFQIPSLDDVKEHLKNAKDGLVNIHCEVWRCTSQRFDPHNYAHTIKQPLDRLVKDGYLEDDSWNFVNSMSFSGGGASAWNRRKNAINQELPNELTSSWWREQMKGQCMEVTGQRGDLTSIMIRILFDPVK